jgi:hypothetical protein
MVEIFKKSLRGSTPADHPPAGSRGGESERSSGARTAEFLSRSVEFAPYKAKIAQLSDDFDFDGILSLANDLLKEERS